MDNEIHRIEVEAYAAVLKAFIVQSEDLTWAKEGVITDLRKELRLSDAEHREILVKVHSDDTIKSIRERRNSVTNQQQKSAEHFGLVSYEYDKRQKLATPLPSRMYPCQPSSVATPMSMASSPKYITSAQRSSAPPRMRFSFSKHPPHAHPSPTPLAVPKAVPMPSPLTVQSRGSSETTIIEQHMAPHSEAKRIERCSSKIRLPGKKKQAPKKGYVDSGSDVIVIPDTDRLIDEVEKICGAEANDAQLIRAKMVLREHERALMEAIRKIAVISDEGACEKEECVEARQMEMQQGFCYEPNYKSIFKLKRARKDGDAFTKICYV